MNITITRRAALKPAFPHGVPVTVPPRNRGLWRSFVLLGLLLALAAPAAQAVTYQTSASPTGTYIDLTNAETAVTVRYYDWSDADNWVGSAPGSDINSGDT
ncbi:MAG: hypothetical protein GY732_16285, partial [Gammaproteobacteria bacterium]|nr:hypothetical protein [Gammaproteobacteria bacterium]